MHDAGKVIAAKQRSRLGEPRCQCERVVAQGIEAGRRQVDAAAIRTSLRAKAPQGWRCSRPRCQENSPSTSCMRDGGQQEVAASQTRIAACRKIGLVAAVKQRSRGKRCRARFLAGYHCSKRQVGSGRITRDSNRAGIDVRTQPTVFDERDRLEHVVERRGERMFRREPVIDAEHRTTGFDREIAHGAVMGIDGPERPSAPVHEHDDRKLAGQVRPKKTCPEHMIAALDGEVSGRNSPAHLRLHGMVAASEITLASAVGRAVRSTAGSARSRSRITLICGSIQWLTTVRPRALRWCRYARRWLLRAPLRRWPRAMR